MRLYTKGLLAFALVIILAVVAVALLVGERTQTEFRQYSVLNSSRTPAKGRARPSRKIERKRIENCVKSMSRCFQLP